MTGYKEDRMIYSQDIRIKVCGLIERVVSTGAEHGDCGRSPSCGLVEADSVGQLGDTTILGPN